jgi:hypothetical protein
MMDWRVSMLSAKVSAVVLLIISLASSSVAYAGSRATEETIAARRLCSRVADIKRLPFRRDEVNVEAFKQLDPVYGELRMMGDAVAPCLIAEVTNRARMKDPRQAPIYKPVLVGDVAFWVFLDITGMQLETALPQDIRKKFKNQGIYAYFDWIRRSGNREKLQANLSKWYANRTRMHHEVGSPSLHGTVPQ